MAVPCRAQPIFINTGRAELDAKIPAGAVPVPALLPFVIQDTQTEPSPAGAPVAQSDVAEETELGNEELLSRACTQEFTDFFLPFIDCFFSRISFFLVHLYDLCGTDFLKADLSPKDVPK